MFDYPVEGVKSALSLLKRDFDMFGVPLSRHRKSDFTF
jgi:hypothetical protein